MDNQTPSRKYLRRIALSLVCSNSSNCGSAALPVSTQNPSDVVRSSRSNGSAGQHTTFWGIYDRIAALREGWTPSSEVGVCVWREIEHCRHLGEIHDRTIVWWV